MGREPCMRMRMLLIDAMAPPAPDKADSPEKWVQAKWEELIVKFLVKTIEDVNDDEWTVALCEEMARQFPLYQAFPQLKVTAVCVCARTAMFVPPRPLLTAPMRTQSMLFKFTGVVLQQCAKKAVVREKLDFLFSVVDHNVTEDREARRRRASFSAALC
jgi:hypothetical protein